jgi:murein DD-endopeptidase MepM/ murein hydrolase activator NlpD
MALVGGRAVLRAEVGFQLPTANHHVLEPGGEPRFFAPTVGKLWPSGTFGCVRTDGNQLHEGIDILHLEVDRRGEPTDPVMAVADGVVAYVNTRTGLSNYGNYLVVRHSVDGLTLFSLYAHLRAMAPGIQAGTPVRQGQVIATMGRTSNTRSGIGKDRAHLHLEFDFQLSPRYAEWHARHKPDERNDHGNWNGQNLIGVDPWQLYLEQHRQGARFNLVRWVRSQTELCRVFVPSTSMAWVRANPGLVRANARTQKEGMAGYELAWNFMGLPFECTPRSAAEMRGATGVQLLYVNEAEASQHHCRHLLVRHGSRWELSAHGMNLVSLLQF